MEQQQLELKSLRQAGKVVPAGGATYYRRAAESLKRYVRRGNLQAGERLPSFRSLAESLEISKFTLDRALGQLEQEGVIERQHGRGIFVADRLSTGELAVVMSSSLMAAGASPIYRLAYVGLVEAIHKFNSHWQVKMHSGRSPETSESHAASLDLMETDVLGRLRGVFTFHDLYNLEESLAEAGIPVITMGSRSQSIGKYRVGFDGQENFLHKAVEHLHDVGCRSVGLMWQKVPWSTEQHDRKLAEEAKLFGMRCRQEWMSYTDNEIMEQGGFDLFMDFWQQPVRPEAVVVLDDVFCIGVLRAIMHLGLEMPRDIKLITYANKDVELPYHKPISRIEYDSAEQTRIATEMMMGLIQGKEPPERDIELPGKLIAGQTTA